LEREGEGEKGGKGREKEERKGRGENKKRRGKKKEGKGKRGEKGKGGILCSCDFFLGKPLRHATWSAFCEDGYAAVVVNLPPAATNHVTLPPSLAPPSVAAFGTGGDHAGFVDMELPVSG